MLRKHCSQGSDVYFPQSHGKSTKQAYICQTLGVVCLGLVGRRDSAERRRKGFDKPHGNSRFRGLIEANQRLRIENARISPALSLFSLADNYPDSATFATRRTKHRSAKDYAFTRTFVDKALKSEVLVNLTPYKSAVVNYSTEPSVGIFHHLTLFSLGFLVFLSKDIVSNAIHPLGYHFQVLSVSKS
jgi:hypothetical protein